jgi:hypothetical protein
VSRKHQKGEFATGSDGSKATILSRFASLQHDLQG